MKSEQVEQLISLHSTFYADCDRISQRLSVLDKDFMHVTEYGIEESGKNVVCFGTNLPYGQSHYDPIMLQFPVELLSATDEEINKYIRKNLNK